MKNTRELLGRRIRELRKGCGLSQEQLSEMVDVDPQYISRIELGKRAPSLETLESTPAAGGVGENVNIASCTASGKISPKDTRGS